MLGDVETRQLSETFNEEAPRPKAYYKFEVGWVNEIGVCKRIDLSKVCILGVKGDNIISPVYAAEKLGVSLMLGTEEVKEFELPEIEPKLEVEQHFPTEEEFMAWWKGKEDISAFGARTSTCPIARYLHEHGFPKAIVAVNFWTSGVPNQSSKFIEDM